MEPESGERGRQAPFQPVPVEEAVALIAAECPAVVFAPHVETASGMILPDGYMKQIADAVHAVGGLFVLDCIASGTRSEAHTSELQSLMRISSAVFCLQNKKRYKHDIT